MNAQHRQAGGGSLLARISWWKLTSGIVLAVGVIWIYRYITIPPPGRVIDDQGRKHVPAEEVAKTTYNSNPPVSGSHVETWVKPGIYTEPQVRGELIHSLEHGYVNIHYNCGSNPGPPEASGSATNNSDDCKSLVTRLTGIAKQQKLFKLIVVPDQTITNRIVLTAWDHLDAFDVFDEERIVGFIAYYRDHGPEQTME